MQKTLIEVSKKINIIGEYDVVVVGGGIAGVSAALAASRNNAKVCVIEKENALGGLATLGLVVFYLPLCDGMGNQVISGIGEELLKLSVKDGYDKIPDCWQKNGNKKRIKKHRYEVKFNPASFILTMEEQILKNKIKILYDTRFCDVVIKNTKIKALIVENKSGRNAVLCKTVIDTSGDADVCYKAGEKTVSLNTNRKSGWFFLYNNGKIELRVVGDPLYTYKTSCNNENIFR
ncbi:MAG: FAD-dependent oxidoreductase [Candidatus Firestonebacteria bacterium]